MALFGRKRKSRKFFHTPVGLMIFLAFSFFIILFLSIKYESQNIFFNDGCSCNKFKDDRNSLIEAVEPDKKWILIGDEFGEEEKIINLKVKLAKEAKKYFDEPNSVRIFYELINTENEQLKSSVLDGYFSASSLINSDELLFEEKINVSSLPVGKYKANIKVEFDCGEALGFYENIFISYPLYVAWSFDWEGYDIKNEYLKDIDNLCKKHDNFPLSHLINPRLFITKTIPQARQDYIRDWLAERKNNRGDSLGLHLHMFYENLEAANIDIPEKDITELEEEFYALAETPAASSPSAATIFDKSKLEKKQIYDLSYWGYSHDDGYDILVTNFSYSDLDKILKWSKNLFKDIGLGTPTTYRSGGWFADLTTLRALQDNGFTVDTSGRTKYNFGTNEMPGFWDLSITSQPYHPNTEDQNSAMAPNIKIWEFPNNGADSWWYSTEQMIERFNLNWGAVGETLGKRTAVVFLTHPDWFHVDESKVDKVFNYIDVYLNSKDNGPVIYENLENLYKTWEDN